MLSEAQVYRREAQRCQERLTRVSDPRARQMIEQELQDWSELAERHLPADGPPPMATPSN